MEPVLIAAYRHLLETRWCTVDDILEDPDHRAEFLALTWEGLPERSERDLLHGLTNLRKRGKLPRRADLIPW
ncbi:MAG: hypothetical protein J2P46_04840 [Zavarzinella sp.]|nr:hypothetical protein [Zavarzinella sp.]